MLHFDALPTGYTDTVRVLIEHGARACLRTEHGWTAAHFAAESGRLAVLRLLHALHAPVDKEDCCGDKPARIAEIYGHQECVQFLKRFEKKSGFSTSSTSLFLKYFVYNFPFFDIFLTQSF